MLYYAIDLKSATTELHNVIKASRIGYIPQFGVIRGLYSL